MRSKKRTRLTSGKNDGENDGRGKVDGEISSDSQKATKRTESGLLGLLDSMKEEYLV